MPDEARRNLPSINRLMTDTVKSNDKESFAGAQSEIILFEAAARELKRPHPPPPTTESMKTELLISTQKGNGSPYGEAKPQELEAQEYDTVKQNVDALLAVPKEQEQQRRHELK